MAAAVCSTAAGGAYENYENYENYEICCWGAVCAALPSGNSASCITQWSLFRPSQTRQRQSKPTGYNETHPYIWLIWLIRLIRLMQASRPRRLHTPVAIKLPSITLRELCALPYPAVILGTLILYGCGGLQYRGGRRL